MTATTTAAGDVSASMAGRVWTPRPWRAECRRADVGRVGRFAHERALRKADIDLSPGAHHVVSVLASYGDEHGGNIFPSQQTLATVCRRSVRHVRAKLRELTELGLVRRLSHGGGRPTYRGGRARRVTPARYELTLPTSLTTDDTDRRPPAKRTGGMTGKASPEPPAQTTTPPRQAHDDGELFPQTVEQIREALGVASLSEQHAAAVIAAAVARAPGAVTNRVSYALAVIRSDPGAFRPTPDVTEPPCPLHPGHPTTRCPQCAAAKSGPTPAFLRMRATLRKARAP